MFQTFSSRNVFILKSFVQGTGESRVMQSAFTSQEVVELTGITARQLQWWDERKIVVPAREGHRRLYTFDDVAEIAVICELRHRGFSLQRVRKVIRFLQRELGKRLVETVSAGAEYHLLTDGQNIFLENSAQGVIDVLKNSRQPLLSICLSDTVHQIRGEVLGNRKIHKKDAVRSVARPSQRVAGGLRRYRRVTGSNGSTTGQGTGEIVS
jgi:DNA-binding transcriptional MerR regulator